MLILPVMGVVDVYLGHRFDDDSKQKKLSGIIAAWQNPSESSKHHVAVEGFA